MISAPVIYKISSLLIIIINLLGCHSTGDQLSLRTVLPSDT